MVNCCVPSCNSSDRNCKGTNVTFFEIPSNLELRQKWLNSIKRDDDWTPGDRTKVCSLHFKHEDFRVGLKLKRLKPIAVPSIFDEFVVQIKKLQSSNGQKKTTHRNIQNPEAEIEAELKEDSCSSAQTQTCLEISPLQKETNGNEALVSQTNRQKILKPKYERQNLTKHTVQTAVRTGEGLLCFPNKGEVFVDNSDDHFNQHDYCVSLKTVGTQTLNQASFLSNLLENEAPLEIVVNGNKVGRPKKTPGVVRKKLRKCQRQIHYLKKKNKQLSNRWKNLRELHYKYTRPIIKQLEKVEADAAAGILPAQFLADQIYAYGAKRKDWSDDVMKNCLLWRQKAPQGYDFGRSLQLMRLPGRSTLNRYRCRDEKINPKPVKDEEYYYYDTEDHASEEADSKEVAKEEEAKTSITLPVAVEQQQITSNNIYCQVIVEEVESFNVNGEVITEIIDT